MNERTLEMAQQAGLKKEHGSDREYMGDFDWREFAQLIIQECATLTLDHRSNDYYQGWLGYRDDIRRHFGVEQ